MSTKELIAVLSAGAWLLGARETGSGGALTEDYRPLGYLYVSPKPGAEYVPRRTRYVLVRFLDVSPGEVTNLSTFVTVIGSESGDRTGQTRVASDGRTVVFEMPGEFSGGETVTVALDPKVPPGAGRTVLPFQYQFTITGATPASELAGADAWLLDSWGNGSEGQGAVSAPAGAQGAAVPGGPAGGARVMPNGVSVPSDFSQVDISVNTNPEPGYIFLDSMVNGSYNVIFDNAGSPIWYQKTQDDRIDMKVQRNGSLTMLTTIGGNRFLGFDTSYRQVATYRAGNGYSTDIHELVLLEDGGYLLLGDHSSLVDMSRYVPNGKTRAYVIETVIQEFTAANELIFQWRAWDNYDIRDLQLDSTGSASMRFPHMNAIDIDADGHLLVSCRHLSEVTKIDRNSGEIIWRLGGAHSDFTFVNDPLNGFTSQHAIRSLGNGRYTLFDNGNLHDPPMSRGVEYELDPENMTATVVWQYPETPSTNLYAYYMGNVQRLPNGNTLINWAVGHLPKLTEVRPDGTKAFEMNWVDQADTYRVFRFPWQGNAWQPTLVVEPAVDSVTLLFNKFGDTNVAYYRIYGATSPAPVKILATSKTTLKRLTPVVNGATNYFRVTAVLKDGRESDFSNEEKLLVNIVQPGQNMVRNGDFSEDKDHWTWAVSGTASASWDIVEEASAVHVISPGSQLADIQLRQTGVKLLQGREYVLALEAWSAAPRPVEVRVEQSLSPWATYKVVNPLLTPVRHSFSYPFVMANATDLNARVAINLGAGAADVTVDNLTLFQVPPGDFNKDGHVGLDDLNVLTSQWLQTGSGLAADLNGDGRVDFDDYEIFGENWLSGGGP